MHNSLGNQHLCGAITPTGEKISCVSPDKCGKTTEKPLTVAACWGSIAYKHFNMLLAQARKEVIPWMPVSANGKNCVEQALHQGNKKLAAGNMDD